MYEIPSNDTSGSDALVCLGRRGWVGFPVDEAVQNWLSAAGPKATEQAQDPQFQQKWLRHGGTWFVGADVLGNGADGSVAGSGPLSGAAADICARVMQNQFDWGPGQVSVCYPGYPRQDADESAANHRFRMKRDAAHLDGLKPVGPNRRRFMQEYHGLILGLPTHNVQTGASPMVVWESSHLILQDMLTAALGHLPPADWADQDLTDVYTQTRRLIFDTCPRVEVTAPKGGAYLIHRFALHGVAPWADATDAHRTIIYFRPFWAGDLRQWLSGP